MSDKFYYDYSKIDSYPCPVKIIISRRGLGKTFGKKFYCIKRFLTKKERFIYVVETGEMVKTLTQNNGEKFFADIINYLSQCNTSRKRYFYNKITELVVDEDDSMYNQRVANAKVVGGTLKINGETAGYIVDMNAFGEIKRNSFVDVATVIVDEFISEKLDKTTLDNPKKVSSIIQSIIRLNNVNIYLLGNSVRLDDSILSRMGFKLERYGFYKKYDSHGLLAVLHFVSPSSYTGFALAHSHSVAGRFAALLGETNEEENTFIKDIPDERKLTSLQYKRGGFSVNVVKKGIVVSLREMLDGTVGCVPFSNNRCKMLYCLNEREQGYTMGFHVVWDSNLKKSILNMLRADCIRYYSEVEYNQLKIILQGE